MARESKNGGSVKTNAAAIQSSGRRGMLLSLLLLVVLVLLLLLMVLSPEQTQCAQATVKMHLPKSRRNFKARKAKAIRLPCTFSLNYQQRELRQLSFHISKPKLEKIETHRALRVGCKLFCHQRLPARHSFPINVTLGFPGYVVADAGEIVVRPEALLSPAVHEL